MQVLWLERLSLQISSLSTVCPIHYVSPLTTPSWVLKQKWELSHYSERRAMRVSSRMPTTGLKMLIVLELGPESEVRADDHGTVWLDVILVACLCCSQSHCHIACLFFLHSIVRVVCSSISWTPQHIAHNHMWVTWAHLCLPFSLNPVTINWLVSWRLYTWQELLMHSLAVRVLHLMCLQRKQSNQLPNSDSSVCGQNFPARVAGNFELNSVRITVILKNGLFSKVFFCTSLPMYQIHFLHAHNLLLFLHQCFTPTHIGYIIADEELFEQNRHGKIKMNWHQCTRTRWHRTWNKPITSCSILVSELPNENGIYAWNLMFA